MITYALRYKNKYLKFGSYGGVARTVDQLSKASLYSSVKLAEKRRSSRYGGVYIHNEPGQTLDIEIVEVELTITNETVID